jgi:hypothetical protein
MAEIQTVVLFFKIMFIINFKRFISKIYIHICYYSKY